MNIMQAIRDGRSRPTARSRRPSRINWPVFFVGQFFWLVETSYFGWNLAPQSEAEVICDGIFLLITALSFRPASSAPAEPKS
jgi:hypothetical protein